MCVYPRNLGSGSLPGCLGLFSLSTLLRVLFEGTLNGNDISLSGAFKSYTHRKVSLRTYIYICILACVYALHI